MEAIEAAAAGESSCINQTSKPAMSLKTPLLALFLVCVAVASSSTSPTRKALLPAKPHAVESWVRALTSLVALRNGSGKLPHSAMMP